MDPLGAVWGVVGMGCIDTTYNSTSTLGTCNDNETLDPVGSTACYEVVKLCTRLV